MVLEMEEGAMSQGMWAGSRCGKRHGKGFCLELPEGDTLILSSVRLNLYSDLQNCKRIIYVVLGC